MSLPQDGCKGKPEGAAHLERGHTLVTTETFPSLHQSAHSLEARRRKGEVVGLQKAGDGCHQHCGAPPDLVPAGQAQAAGRWMGRRGDQVGDQAGAALARSDGGAWRGQSAGWGI
jgi:hypothetical protein